MTQLVEVVEQESHFLLKMDDGKANALGFAMFEQLNAGLDKAAQTDKVVVIAGRPGKFSAGFDLAVMGEGGENTLKLMRQGADMAARLMGFETPVVLAVSGHALAMGAFLCLSADYRIGIRGDFKIGLNEVAIGMTVPWFGLELARARLARHHFNMAVGLARIHDPETAVAAGFLDEVVDPDALEGRAADMAGLLSSLNMKAHRNTKARVREEFFQRYEQAMRRDFEEGGVAASSAS